jgi:hypothetical protein
VPDGRVVVVIDPAKPPAMLPGGTVDPATDRRLVRLLATSEQAAALLGRGAQGYEQARLASRTAHLRGGIPSQRPHR